MTATLLHVAFEYIHRFSFATLDLMNLSLDSSNIVFVESNGNFKFLFRSKRESRGKLCSSLRRLFMLLVASCTVSWQKELFSLGQEIKRRWSLTSSVPRRPK